MAYLFYKTSSLLSLEFYTYNYSSDSKEVITYFQTPLVDNDHIDVAGDNDETFTYKFGKPISSSAGTISINATGATGAGAGKVYIYYI